MSASEDGVLAVWRIASGKRLSTFKAMRGEVRAVRFSDDGKLVVGDSGAGGRFWDAGTGREIKDWDFDPLMP